MNEAFGKPGISPTWAKAAKQGVGTALSDASKVWFTIAEGFITEVYYPTVDIANSRDIKFFISDSRTFFDEEGKDTTSTIEYLNEKAPAYLITNTAKSGKYRILKRVLTDPEANCLVINMAFEALEGMPDDYKLYVQFAPHIKNRGYDNSGRCAEYGGRGYLIAWREDIAGVITSDVPFLKMSAGYSGASDGWHDLRDNLNMDWTFDRALDGNIALMAELPVGTAEFNLVLGFGKDEIEAILEANKTVSKRYRTIERDYVRGWKHYMANLERLDRYAADKSQLFWTSAMVLKTHEDKTYKGGVIASLSVPWGESKGDRDSLGYHLIWPRDLVKGAFGFMAMGDDETPVNIIKFLQRTQNLDGSWPQNMTIEGTPYWPYVQIDEVALPVMLARRLKGMGLIGDEFYPMVKKAAAYIAKHGPVTEQERWEENTGFSPATLAAEISALVCAGEWAKEIGERTDAEYLLTEADYWATRVEEWTFSECDCIGENLPGHYLRIVKNPPEALSPAEQLCHALVFIRNVPEDVPHHQGEIVDASFLELVRYGIRDARDPNILASIHVIDKLIRFDAIEGTAFYRYNFDAYGEKEDGSPFDGTGIGRPWPLITGERAMYEVEAGNDSTYYIKSLENFANEGFMIPEQIWDRNDIPERGLFRGKGAGSATPLMWAHSEYIKDLRSLRDGKGCDVIDEVKERYIDLGTVLHMSAWKKNKPIYVANSSDRIRIISFERAELVWTADEWRTRNDTVMRETGLGIYFWDFEPQNFEADTKLVFTFHYTDTNTWEGKDYVVNIFERPAAEQAPARAEVREAWQHH